MFYRVNYFVVIGLAAVIGLTGYKTYFYFFDTTPPIISMTGIENNLHAGDIACRVASNKKEIYPCGLMGSRLLVTIV